MLPELGQFALILALLLAALQAFFGIAGPALGRDRWVAAVTPAVAGQFVMVATAVGVPRSPPSSATTSRCATSRRIPTPRCRCSTAWPRCGARTKARCCCGSSCWRCWTRRGRDRRRAPAARASRARVLGVLGLVSFGFLLFTLATSNPFLRLDPAPRRTART